MENEITIQLRYCFNDDNLNSMNAEIFNECEKQFIKAIKSADKYLESNLTINIKPRKEGSLIDILTIVIDKPEFTATFVTLFIVFVTKFFDSEFSPAKHNTDETGKKLENVQSIKEAIKNGLTEEEFGYIASKDKDLRKLKSNFFKIAKKRK